MTATTLEPFPLYMDLAPSADAQYFSHISSKMSSLHAMATSSSQNPFKPRLDKIQREIQILHYQYEVTFGLYMLNSNEKMVLNSIVLVVLSAIMYGVYCGLQPYLINAICRLVYYVTGSLTAAGDICEASAATSCTG
jgi:hypothetical protein